MWTCWYQPSNGNYGPDDRSAKEDFLSGLHTTMPLENFWGQLKHNYLHHLVSPQIDHLFWIIHTQVYPNYLLHAKSLEDNFHLGNAWKMTAFQVRFKAEWKCLSEVPTSGQEYIMNISRWTCTCRAIQYNAFHLCKHLVQSIPSLPPTFWNQVVRHHTMPLYCHPVLRPIREPEGTWDDPDAGSVTDGDNHIFLEDKKVLTNGNWCELLEDSFTSLSANTPLVPDQRELQI